MSVARPPRTIDRSRDRVALSDRSSSRSPARCVASPPPSSPPCCSPSASRPCRSTPGRRPRSWSWSDPSATTTRTTSPTPRDIAAEARKHTSNVVTLFTPNATWPAVKAAAQGASVFVYLGHGNGWPSIYPPFQTVTKDGLGLDPQSGADGDKHVYYGEDYIRNNIRLAPNAVVLLYHLCYASGNTEPGLSQGTFAEARERVDNYGAGFIGAGARAVIAEGHPDHPATSEIRQLFTTNRTMDQVFRNAPTWHGHLQGPFASQRTPGLAYQMDADTSSPSGFYRSIVGDLGLRASAVTGATPSPTGASPADFVVPGAAEVVAAGGVGLFGSLAKAQDPSATAATTIARRDAAAPDRRGGARDRRHAGLRGHRARDLDQRLRPGHRPRPARLGAHRDLVAGSERRRSCRRTATAPTTSSSSPPGSPSGSPPRSRSGTPRATPSSQRPSTATSSASPGTSTTTPATPSRTAPTPGRCGRRTTGATPARRRAAASRSTRPRPSPPPASIRRPASTAGRSRRSTWRSAPRTRCPGSGRSATGSRAAP